MKLVNKIKSFVICAGLMLHSVAWADYQIQQVVDNFAKQPSFSHSNISVCVQNIKSGELVAEYASDKALPTASTMKTLTGATALAMLGDDYRFHTLVTLQGEQKGDTFYGNVILVGGGDPTLGSSNFPNKASFVDNTITALENKGIRNITGCFIVDSSNYDRYGNSLDIELEDLGADYGVGVYAINYKDNLLGFNIGSKDGQIKVKLNKKFECNINQFVQLGQKENLVIIPYPAAKPSFYITGEFPSNRKTQFYEVGNPKPEAELLYDLEQACARKHIQLQKRRENFSKLKSSVLLDYESPKLAEIIKSLLVRSDNMYADALLLELAKANQKEPRRDNGVQVVKQFWHKQGLDLQPLFMFDGSGLSRKNSASARFFSQMLAKAENTKGRSAITLKSLMPVLGEDLYISKNLTKAKLGNSLAAKSGSMTNVQCYVGYYPADKPIYAWSVLVNNFHGHNQNIRNEIGKLLVEAFKNK